jgi:hypothetical protein
MLLTIAVTPKIVIKIAKIIISPKISELFANRSTLSGEYP